MKYCAASLVLLSACSWRSLPCSGDTFGTKDLGDVEVTTDDEVAHFACLMDQYVTVEDLTIGEPSGTGWSDARLFDANRLGAVTSLAPFGDSQFNLSIGGSLIIRAPSLATLEGLESLTGAGLSGAGDGLQIRAASTTGWGAPIPDLRGLEGFRWAESLVLRDLPVLESLRGLGEDSEFGFATIDPYDEFSGGVTLENLPSLESLEGMPDSLSIRIEGVPRLRSLDGLEVSRLCHLEVSGSALDDLDALEVMPLGGCNSSRPTVRIVAPCASDREIEDALDYFDLLASGEVEGREWSFDVFISNDGECLDRPDPITP